MRRESAGAHGGDEPVQRDLVDGRVLLAQGGGHRIETSLASMGHFSSPNQRNLLKTLRVPIRTNKSKEIQAFLLGFIWICLEGIRSVVVSGLGAVRVPAAPAHKILATQSALPLGPR
jgi:hypothetical protein